MRLRAEEANRAKSDFLAVMSHELRTPLNPILGFSELLLEEVDNPEHKEIVKTIVESGTHLIELINEVLDYSKVEAGKQEVVFDDFSMESLLEEKMRLMRGQLKGKPVEIRSELDKGPFEQTELPLFVGDESKPSLQLQGEDGSRKILIVEDNQDSVFFLEKLLSRIGFDPVSTMNGEDALEMYTARDVEPSAILLDLHMPGMDGFATLKAIRAFETSSGLAPIPVFILTADVQEKTRKECFAHGANDFITKPVAIDVLRNALMGLSPWEVVRGVAT